MTGPRGTRAPKNPKSCHERALGLLAVRPRSRREVLLRLSRAGFDPDEVAGVIGRLESVGLLDDEAFARDFAEHSFSVRRSGRRAVVQGLLAKGVARDIAERAADGAKGPDTERAEDLAREKAARMRQLDPAVAFRRLTGLLARRGYSGSVARDAARHALSVTVDDE